MFACQKRKAFTLRNSLSSHSLSRGLYMHQEESFSFPTLPHSSTPFSSSIFLSLSPFCYLSRTTQPTLNDMDHSALQDQEIQSHSLENMLVSSNGQQESKPRPQPEQALKCPRCESTNTKFCYYNNYSLSQPRYFCKSCRRYWTKGGTLRNVPVGGGCRKNKRSSSSSSFSSKFRPQDQPLSLSGFSSLSYDSNDLDLAFARLQKNFSGQSFDEHDFTFLGNSSATHCDPVAGNHGFSDISSTGFHGVTSFQNLYHWFDNGNSYSGNQRVENGGRIFVGSNEETGFPIEELMSNSSAKTVTEKTTKQELINGENKGLWGFPWQTTGEGNMEDFHLTRESWNGNAIASSWQHGLLHTPLM